MPGHHGAAGTVASRRRSAVRRGDGLDDREPETGPRHCATGRCPGAGTANACGRKPSGKPGPASRTSMSRSVPSARAASTIVEPPGRNVPALSTGLSSRSLRRRGPLPAVAFSRRPGPACARWLLSGRRCALHVSFMKQRITLMPRPCTTRAMRLPGSGGRFGGGHPRAPDHGVRSGESVSYPPRLCLGRDARERLDRLARHAPTGQYGCRDRGAANVL